MRLTTTETLKIEMALQRTNKMKKPFGWSSEGSDLKIMNIENQTHDTIHSTGHYLTGRDWVNSM